MGAFVLCCLRVSHAICKDKGRSALLSLRWGGGITYRKKQHIMARLARARAVSHAPSDPHALRRSAPSVRSAGEGVHAGEGRLKFFLSL